MAELSDELFETTFTLLKQLAVTINLASATEWNILEQYGETEATITELDELSSVRERLSERYVGLNNILLRVMAIQPVAPQAMLESLVKVTQKAQAMIDSANASIREVKRNWNLL